MRRIMVCAFFAVCFATIMCVHVSSGFADNPLDKLWRGLSNCWTCQQEYIDAVHEDLYSNGPIGILTGSIKGIAKMAIRGLAGIYDVATFPIPIPWRYKPVIKPAINI